MYKTGTVTVKASITLFHTQLC